MKIFIKLLIIISGIFLLDCSLQAQQGSNWFFGKNAAINFSTSPPLAVLNGSLNTFEGCASLSDNNGQLMFYTDGLTVWNRNHQAMTNGTGLKGDPSSSNAAIIIPIPGSDSLFYIFTSDAAENTNKNGYTYSEVDISLNGGLGDVTGTKNILLYAPSTEKLTAVRHANGLDIWIVTHGWNNNTWNVYKIDCNGINSLPVQSNVGSTYNEQTLFDTDGGQQLSNEGSVGCLKPSPDGKKIATTRINVNGWEIFNFNNSTGILSDAVSLSCFAPYGLEFSPDSKLIYVASERWGYDYSYITQYNLASHNAVSITASGVQIGVSQIAPSIVRGAIGALQLGPDDKIYCAIEQDSILGVINAPNNSGTGCNFIPNQIDLKGRLCQRGLPVFFPGLITNQNVNFDWSANNTCSVVNFSGNATINGNLSWYWDFGDGATAVGQNVSHNFNPGSNYTVMLTVSVTTVCGTGKAKSVKQINLTANMPVSKFGTAVNCNNAVVTFTDSSAVPNGTIISWMWDFGDGQTSTAQNPIHIYLNNGSYNVSLTTISSGMCNNTAAFQKTVVILPKLIADFSFSAGCLNIPLQFIDISTANGATITNWFWDFGNGTGSQKQNPENSFNLENDYQVKFSIATANGCHSDTIVKTLHINPRPNAQFSFKGGCENQATSFIDQSEISKGNVVAWNWDFSQVGVASQQSPTIYFPAPGNYTAKLVVQSDKNCTSDTVTKAIIIESKPLAAFAMADGCSGQPNTPSNNSSILSGTITNYFWNNGEGLVSALAQPSFRYQGYGKFDVKLVAISKNGCVSDSSSQTVNIESKPAVNFHFANTCPGNPIAFENTSTNEYGSIISWDWNFGDQQAINHFKEPVITYKSFGSYTITLTAKTANGCIASLTKQLSIKPIIISAGNDTIVAINQPLYLNASGAKDYVWSPALYLDFPFIQSPTALLQKSQTYFLTGVTEEGCIGYDTINIKVYKGPDIYVPNAFTPNGDKLNDIFRPVLPGIKVLPYFKIYNRWGKLVFYTQEIGRGWDGKVNGVTQSAGSYVWLLRVTTYDGQVFEKKGTVILMR